VPRPHVRRPSGCGTPNERIEQNTSRKTDLRGHRRLLMRKTSAEIVSIAESIPSEWESDAGEQTYVAYLFSDVDKPGLVSELPVKMEFLTIY
jgi:hypothetical protein